LGLPSRLLGALLACAASAGVQAGDLTLHLGDGSRYRHVMLAYETESLWQPRLAGRSFDVAFEVSGGRSLAPSGTTYGGIWHVGLTPLVRYWLTPNTAIEYGLGANVFSDTAVGDKEISTTFQFGNSIGVLHRYAGTPWSTGLRFTHYSNAGIDTPNPGLDYLHLRIGYQLK
jgi:lipid A 3-O-deacylase